MELFGVGLPEIGVVLLIALVIVGPKRFPEVARQVARWINTARSFSDSVMADLRSAVDELEHEVTAQNDGVNPIRELQALRQELTGAARDATSSLTEATTLPALPDHAESTPDDEAATSDIVATSTEADGEASPAGERTA